VIFKSGKASERTKTCTLLRGHFGGIALHELVTSSRTFPSSSRVDLISAVVQKTKNASAAFIKELMRRSAQYRIHTGSSSPLALEHVESALDEMLFAGGSLNGKLLGGATEE